MKTLLDSLIEQGWVVHGYLSYFSNPNNGEKDRYMVMLDPDGRYRKNLETNMLKPIDMEPQCPNTQ